MRKLLWFAIGFTAACALGINLSYGIWLLLAALFCLPCAIVLGLGDFLRRKQAAFALWGCLVCFLWLYGYDCLYLSHARNMDGETKDLTIEISDYSYDLGYGTVTEGKVRLGKHHYRVSVYLRDVQDLTPGNRIKGSFQLQYTAARGKETYHQGDGIFLLAFPEDEIVVIEDGPGKLDYLGARLRHKITNLIDRIFPADTVGFARALLLGDSSLLTYEEDNAFQVSGLRHVIAVSGLHVSILFSLVYLLVGKQRGLTALIGIPVLVLFAAVAGFTPSINRACMMQVLMILAMILNREYDPPTALSCSVVIMLLFNPQTITSVSFQLSAACMVGIFLFSGKINTYLLDEKRFGPVKGKTIRARLIRWICGSVSVSLGAMITTTPLCAWYFGCVSLIGIISNLLILWIVSFLFYGIMLSVVLGIFWGWAANGVAWCISWPIRFVLLSAKILSKIPYAAVYISSVYILAWLIFCYGLLTVFLLCKNKCPVLFGGCIVLTLILSVLASRLESNTYRYRVVVFDVGQGQCVLLQENDNWYLVDCGGDNPEMAADRAADFLLSMGISRLDGVIVTHFDVDHGAGIPLLLSRISADEIYLPDIEDTGSVRKTLEEDYSEMISWIQPGSVAEVEAGTIFAAETVKSSNESGLCILFQLGKCDILITGDRTIAGERALMEQTDLSQVEILIAGHHGAETSTSSELLAAIRPQVVLISVGKDNPFGHPDPAVLERLERYGCQVLRTDIEGTIEIGG